MYTCWSLGPGLSLVTVIKKIKSCNKVNSETVHFYSENWSLGIGLGRVQYKKKQSSHRGHCSGLNPYKKS